MNAWIEIQSNQKDAKLNEYCKEKFSNNNNDDEYNSFV